MFNEQTRRWTLPAIGCLVLVFALAAAVHYSAVYFTGDTVGDKAKAVNDARASIIQVLAGLGLFAGLLYTARTYQLARTTQRAERFTKSVTQLGDASESVRAGGVYSLQLLVAEDSAYWPIVSDLLSAYVREGAKPSVLHAKSDVIAALALLERRPDDGNTRRLDLRGVRLTDVAIPNDAHFSLARFDGALLTGTDLTDAHLRGARFAGAVLAGAILSAADLTDANLARADCRGVNFYRATVKGADISGAKLSGAQNLTAAQRSSMKGVPASEP